MMNRWALLKITIWAYWIVGKAFWGYRPTTACRLLGRGIRLAILLILTGKVFPLANKEELP